MKAEAAVQTAPRIPEANPAHAPEDPLLRAPAAADGRAVHDLIARCPPLDTNSAYCNLLQATHFSGTCVLAEMGGAPVGWVSGYLEPERPDTLFIWQVAVAPEGRGHGLGKRMIREILDRPACRGVRRLTTTITPDNAASWALFRGLAADLDAAVGHEPWFIAGRHFDGGHETEHLVTIGPFAAAAERL